MFSTKKPLLGALAAALALVVALALVGCGGDAADDGAEAGDYKLMTAGKLTSASDFAFPPFEFMDESGAHQGFSVDLVRALADEMGLEADFTDPLKFDTLIPLTKLGEKMDISVASITITDERKEEVDFTDSYLDSNQALAVLKDSGLSGQDDVNQAGMRVAVQSGTSGQDWAQENLPNAEIVILDEVPAAFSALQAGEVNATVVDLPVTAWLINSSYQDAEIVMEIPTGEQYGIAVSKDNPELTKALNEALAAIKANGKYDEIYNQYFAH